MSDSESDNSDLKTALALSLQANLSSILIDFASDDDDESENLGVPSPAKECQSPQSEVDPLTPRNKESGKQLECHRTYEDLVSRPNSILDSQLPRHTSAMLGLDRVAMEAERLARLQHKKLHDQKEPSRLKRKHTIYEDLSEIQEDRQMKAKSSTTEQREEHTVPNHTTTSVRLQEANERHNPNGALHTLSGRETIKDVIARSGSTAQKPSPEVQLYSQQQASQESGIRYPEGIMKRTWVKGCPDENDTIKIEEILQNEDLELAVLSSFQIDIDWITAKILDSTKIVWILHARDEEEKQTISSLAPKNYQFCFPYLGGTVNMMHSKLQLLAHPSHLRVVIPSANLVPYDWGESGVMENVCFLIDLPRLPQARFVDPGSISKFGKELKTFLRAMDVKHSLVESLSRFDFTKTAQYGFVHTIGGSHCSSNFYSSDAPQLGDWNRTGFPALGATIQSLGLATDGAISIDVMTSSLGAISDSFVKSIYFASQGDDGRKQYDFTHKRRSQAGSDTELSSKLSQNNFRIHFPSRETVALSEGGIGAGGTICLQSHNYNAVNFPRYMMRDAKSTRSVLMHNKMIFVQPEQGRAWVYCGSHNLSESAWGRLVKDKKAQEPKLNCRNWECGVIFPVPARTTQPGSESEQSIGDQVDPDLEIFRGHIPIPMITPGKKYGERRPWFFKED